MPALNALQEMIEKNGKYFKVAFSLSGVGMEQLELHAPQVLEKLQQLNNTGCVEFWLSLTLTDLLLWLMRQVSRMR